MIILHDIQTRLAEMKELIGQKAFHPFLIKNIQAPMIDEDKILLLLSFFDQLKIPDIEKQTYITATLLIQLALDTHDHVHIDSIEDDLKSQQLTVLGGDYFSGLYYKHLASVGNITLIRELSNGIKEINEQKILLHEYNPLSNPEQIIEHITKIEGALYVRITDFFGLSAWDAFTKAFLLVKRLLLEREQFMTTGTSICSEAAKKAMIQNYQRGTEISVKQHGSIVRFFDRAIGHHIETMDVASKQLSTAHQLLQMRIQSLKDEHHDMVKTFVEEG